MIRDHRDPKIPVPYILVADDEPGVRKMCRKVLEDFGYMVTEASNGREALRSIEDKFFDMVILDLAMPGLDGFEFITEVRRQLPRIRIIVMSGYMDGPTLKTAKTLGANATLAKPACPNQILRLVCNELDEYYHSLMCQQTEVTKTNDAAR